MNQIGENWKAYGRFLKDMHEESRWWMEMAEQWDEQYRDLLRLCAPYRIRWRLRLYLSLRIKPVKHFWRRVKLATDW